MTSFAVVRDIRRRANNARTGHAGTLDPLASGVLLVCIGRATKAVPRLMELDKRYRAEIDLSAVSSTDDAEGIITASPIDQVPTKDQIESALTHFVGDVLQQPPVYSALKVNGMSAYRRVRRGQTVTLRPRQVRIHTIRIVSYNFPRLLLDVHCGKGVYIRALARDVGRTLGVGGYLCGLVRSAVGSYTVESARSPRDLPLVLSQTDLLSVSSNSD